MVGIGLLEPDDSDLREETFISPALLPDLLDQSERTIVVASGGPMPEYECESKNDFLDDFFREDSSRERNFLVSYVSNITTFVPNPVIIDAAGAPSFSAIQFRKSVLECSMCLTTDLSLKR